MKEAKKPFGTPQSIVVLQSINNLLYDRADDRALQRPRARKSREAIDAISIIDDTYRLNVLPVGPPEGHLISPPATRMANMLTAKGKYGLKALAHLATLEPGGMAQAMDIAGANNIPKKFLDAILGELRNAGIVYSKKGPGGGYMLARRPTQINIGHVIRTLDGPIAPIACASRTAFQPCADCVNVQRCTVRLAMAKVRDAMSDILDSMTLADMLAMKDAKHSETRKIGRSHKFELMQHL